MARIYLRSELDEDIRVKRLARTLGIPAVYACGALWKLWAYAERHSHNGALARINGADIDELVSTPGFASALVEIGWLQVDDDGVTIPRFVEHCGQSQKRRLADRLRKRRDRKMSVRTRSGQGRTRRGRDTDSTTLPQVLDDCPRRPFPSSASASASASAAAPSSASAATSASAPTEKKKKRSTRAARATASNGDWLASVRANPAYTHVDLDRELAKMDAWISIHPGRQKTRKFIVAWLNKIEPPLPEADPYAHLPQTWQCHGNPDGCEGYHQSPKGQVPEDRTCPLLAQKGAANG